MQIRRQMGVERLEKNQAERQAALAGKVARDAQESAKKGRRTEQHEGPILAKRMGESSRLLMQIRRQLRAKRLAKKQAEMRAALAEKVARDAQESAEKERKVELREEYKQRMAAWRQVCCPQNPCIMSCHAPLSRALLCRSSALQCSQGHGLSWLSSL